MAEGYARASGKPGVVLVTSGPGATNVITPMQDALSDGTPLVVFCGQVPTTAIGSDAFQEADVVGISRVSYLFHAMLSRYVLHFELRDMSYEWTNSEIRFNTSI